MISKSTSVFNILPTAIVLFCWFQSNAQCYMWDWAESAGGVLHEVGNTVVSDSPYAIIAGGFYSSSINFGNGVSLPGPDIVDGFVVLYDSSGIARWAIRIWGNWEDKVTSVSYKYPFIATTGYFNSSNLSFKNNSHYVNNIDKFDAFVVVFDTAGNPLWYKSVGATDDDGGACIAIDKYNNIYLTGWFRDDSLVIDGQTIFNQGQGFSSDVFIAKWDSIGNLQWLKSLGSNGDDKPSKPSGCFIDDMGVLWIAGYYKGDTLYVDTLNIPNSNAGSKDGFIVGLDSTGKIITIKTWNGPGNDQIYSCVANEQYIAACGYLSQHVNVDSESVNSNGGNDILLTIWDKDTDSLILLKQWGGNNNEEAYSMDLADENIAITGSYKSNPLMMDSFTLSKNGQHEVFVAVVDIQGNVVWAKRAGKSESDEAYDVSWTPNKDVVITGYFESSSISFRNPHGPDITKNNSFSNWFNTTPDFFIARVGNRLPVINADLHNPACFGDSSGSIQLTISGSGAPFHIVWNTGDTTNEIINVPADTYIVSITTQWLCTVHDTFVLLEPLKLSIDSFLVVNPTCAGDSTGSISIYPSGGTSPYSIYWNTGDSGAHISNLPSGTYIFALYDSNSCSIIDTIEVSEPAPITIRHLNIVSDSCLASKGRIELSITGGTGPFTTVWNTGDTTQYLYNIPSGFYQVTIIDANSCQWDTTIYVPYIDTPKVNVLLYDVLCYGDSTGRIVVLPTDSEYISCTWNTGDSGCLLTNIYAGFYSVTISNKYDCIKNLEFFLTEPPPLELSLFSIPDTNNKGVGTAWVNVTGGTPPYSYTWNTGDTIDSIKNLSAGYYNVKVEDSNNCFQTDSIYVANINILGSPLINNNPASCLYDKSTQMLSCPFLINRYTIYSSNGKKICEKKLINAYNVFVKCHAKSANIILIHDSKNSLKTSLIIPTN